MLLEWSRNNFLIGGFPLERSSTVQVTHRCPSGAFHINVRKKNHKIRINKINIISYLLFQEIFTTIEALRHQRGNISKDYFNGQRTPFSLGPLGISGPRNKSKFQAHEAKANFMAMKQRHTRTHRNKRLFFPGFLALRLLTEKFYCVFQLRGDSTRRNLMLHLPSSTLPFP